MPIDFLRQTLHPSWYHGHDAKPPFFEGWYYKLVDASEEARYAIIPGIFKSEEQETAHAFVQVLDGRTGTATYHRYPEALFWAARDRFEVRIGPNYFTERHMSLAIDDDQGAIHGRIYHERPTPWPVSLRSPGIMGWYAYVPLMETYHGVISFDHGLSGALTVAGTHANFDGGRGYIEKDWGASFPAGYVWMQSNHFEEPRISLSASVAVIPWLRSSFPGFIIGLWLDGRLYRFATYTGAETELLRITDDQVVWVVRDRYRRLRLEATRAEGGLLYGPNRAFMGERVGETMLATVEVQLQEWRSQERVLFRGRGRNAGLEVHGDVTRLRQMI
jgi:hypothetical protein